jgi:hypothetical protein
MDGILRLGHLNVNLEDIIRVSMSATIQKRQLKPLGQIVTDLQENQ